MSDFMDLLDYAGDALGKPGRAAKAGLDMLTGGNTDPSELASFLPFSDSLGLTDHRNAVSGTDLASRWTGLSPDSLEGKAAGFGVDLLTDPLTYLGGALGRMGGKALGRGLEEASMARGPGYVRGTDNLLASAIRAGGRDAGYAVEDLMKNPAWAKASSELPAGSEYLGHGAEATVFRTPSGDTARFSRSKMGGETRPIDPGVLPANRTVDYPSLGTEALRIERAPYAPALRDLQSPFWRRDVEHGPTVGMGERANTLQGDLQSRGLDFFDTHSGNVGFHGGRPVVIDPGAVTTFDSFTGSMAPSVAAAQPDRTTRFLLDLLGGQPAMRRALDRGASAPGYQRTLGAAGTMAGATGGAGLGQF